MISSFWPLRLQTPDIRLGGRFADSRAFLQTLGQIEERDDEKDGHMVRVDTDRYSLAIYESSGRVRSVWYDDPSGRNSNIGKRRKLKLYLKRYTIDGQWHQTMNNGWMTYWFNESDKRILVYGLHKDVIRINDQTEKTSAEQGAAANP